MEFLTLSTPVKRILFFYYQLCLLCLGLSFSSLVHCSSFDDWISCTSCSPLCGGYYQEPLLASVPKKQSISDLPLTLTSDSAQFQENGLSTLTGHVHLIQGNRELFGERALIYSDPKTRRPHKIHTEGKVRLLQPHYRVDAAIGDWLVQEDVKILQDATFRLYDRHAHGYAKEARIEQDKRFHFTNLKYSTCNPLQPTWQLSAKEAHLDKISGRGQFYHPYLVFKGVPVFYMPYLNVPIDDRRQTGFLYPYFGSTIGLPFYWNLAPHYDMTITAKWYPKRNTQAIEDQFRYVTPHHHGKMKITYLPKDREYEKFRMQRKIGHPGFLDRDPRVKALDKGPERYAFQFTDEGHFGPHFKSVLNYERVSDDNYFADLGDSLGMASHTYLAQEGRLEYRGERASLIARLQEYQTLHPYYGPVTQDIYRRFPQIGGRIESDTLPLSLKVAMEGEFTHFLHPIDPLTNGHFPEGHRYYMRPSISLPIRTPGWTIQPRLQWDMTHYVLIGRHSLSRTPPKQFTRSLPIFDLDSEWVFERPVTIRKQAFFQTLEPKLYYLYVPYKDQTLLPTFDSNYSTLDYYQLFRDNRFNGRDRLGDTQQLTLGITSRFLEAPQHTERFRINLGQILYFRDRKVTSCSALSPLPCISQNEERQKNKYRRSSIVGLLYYRLGSEWGLNGGLEWNPNTKQTDRQTVMLQYHPTSSNVLNFGYQYLRIAPTLNLSQLSLVPTTSVLQPLSQGPTPSALQQIFTSTAWRIGNTPFRLLGRLHYNIKDQRTNEVWLGIERQGCCNAVRLVVSRFLRPFALENQKKYDTKIFLQFVFKGLGGVGHQQIDNTLKQNIPGYVWNPER